MKSRKLIVGIVSIAVVVSLPVAAAALGKTLSSDMSLEALQKFADKSTYSYMIFEYEKENAEINADNREYELEYYRQLLKNTSKNNSRYVEYMLKAAELEKEFALAKIEQEYYDNGKEDTDKKLLNLALKSKYYELCDLEKQAEIQQANVGYYKKIAEVEAIKFKNGQTTETDFKLIQTNLKIAQNKLSAAEKSVQSKTKEISNFLNQYKDTEAFSVKCKFPEGIAYQKFDVEKLYKKFSNNSFEFEKQLKSMEYDKDYLEQIASIYGKDSDTYKTYSNSYEIDCLNWEISINECKSKISEMIESYEQAYTEYILCTEYNLILADKLDIIKTAYNTGNMSEVDYLEQYAEISIEMCKADTALAKADLIYDRLCLIEIGTDEVIN